ARAGGRPARTDAGPFLAAELGDPAVREAPRGGGGGVDLGLVGVGGGIVEDRGAVLEVGVGQEDGAVLAGDGRVLRAVPEGEAGGIRDVRARQAGGEDQEAGATADRGGEGKKLIDDGGSGDVAQGL